MRERIRKIVQSRRLPVVVGVILLLMLAVGWTIEHYLQVDRYRPMVIEALSEASGLPVAIDRLDLEFFPAPSICAEAVVIGEDDFRASAEKVHLGLRLGRLLQGGVDISQVWIGTLEITVPGDIEALRARIDSIPQGSRKVPHAEERLQVSVDHVYASEVRVRLAGRKDPVAVCNVDLRDVMSDYPRAELWARVPLLGNAAILKGSGSLNLAPDASPELTGDLRLTGAGLDRLSGSSKLGGLRLDVMARFERATADSASADISGGVTSYGQVKPAVTPFFGRFSGQAWWADGKFTVNDIVWEAPGATATADLTRHEDGLVACRIRKGAVNHAGLNALLPLVSALHAAPRDTAAFSVEECLLAFPSGAAPRIVAGTASMEGLDLFLQDDRLAFGGVHGRVDVKENRFTFECTSENGVSVHGTVEPDFGKGTTRLVLAGSTALSPERLASFVPLGPVRELSGELHLNRLSATFPLKGGGDLGYAFSVEDGRAGIDAPGYADVFTAVHLEATGDDQVVNLKAEGQSGQLQAVALSGAYSYAARKWTGKLGADVAGLALPLDPECLGGRAGVALLKAYGRSDLTVEVQFPVPEAPRLVLGLNRLEMPAFSGRLTVGKQESGWRVEELRADASVPFSTFDAVVGQDVSFEGIGGVALRKEPGEETFELAIDLSPCAISVGDYLYKQAGRPASVTLAGRASEGPWKSERLEVALLDQAIAARYEGERILFDDVDLELGALSELLPPGARVAGRLTGSWHTNPTEADVVLHNVAFDLEEASAIHAANGRVVLRDGLWSCEALTVRGANSECTVNAGWTSDGWRGAVTGKQLDLNAFNALWDTVAAFRTEHASEPEASHGEGQSGAAPEGTFTVDLEELLYRRGLFRNAHAVMEFGDGEVHVQDLAAEAYEGTIAGTATIASPDARGARTVSLKLDLQDMNVRLIDDVCFATPREFAGIVDGTIDLAFPVGGGIVPMHEANGSIRFEARKGSFGKIRVITRLLAILRTTEIFQLRFPSLKDEGLAYDTCTGSVRFENGVATIPEILAENPTMKLLAQGTIDAPKNETNLAFQVSLLGAVTGLIDKVGLDSIAEGVRKYSSFHLAATGPIEDPTVRITKGAALDLLQDEVKRSEEGLSGALRDAAGAAVRGLIGE